MDKTKAKRVLDLICAAASEAVVMTEEERETYRGREGALRQAVDFAPGSHTRVDEAS